MQFIFSGNLLFKIPPTVFLLSVGFPSTCFFQHLISLVFVELVITPSAPLSGLINTNFLVMSLQLNRNDAGVVIVGSYLNLNILNITNSFINIPTRVFADRLFIASAYDSSDFCICCTKDIAGPRLLSLCVTRWAGRRVTEGNPDAVAVDTADVCDLGARQCHRS